MASPRLDPLRRPDVVDDLAVELDGAVGRTTLRMVFIVVDCGGGAGRFDSAGMAL
jgi:hypothetical protein